MIKGKSIFTRAVHAGERGPKPDFEPVSTPIYSTVGYRYESMEDLDRIFGNERDGYVYARYGSPTNSALETALAAMEEGEAALSFGSGMAAVYAALLAAGVKKGTSLLAAYDIYGATYAICARLLPDMGVNAEFVDVTDLEGLGKALLGGPFIGLAGLIVSGRRRLSARRIDRAEVRIEGVSPQWPLPALPPAVPTPSLSPNGERSW